MTSPHDLRDLSFEDAYEELSGIVRQLEGGSLSLEQCVALYERGQQLSAHCQQLLDDAEQRVLTLRGDGTLT